jgi:hypothetical protein
VQDFRARTVQAPAKVSQLMSQAGHLLAHLVTQRLQSLRQLHDQVLQRLDRIGQCGAVDGRRKHVVILPRQ